MSLASPKLVRNKSNLIPIGNTPDVAFGCYHLESFYNHGEGRKAWKILESFYARILTCLREENPVIYQYCLTGKNQAHPTLRPTWLCMQCTSIFNDDTRNEHFQSKGHSFFVQSRQAFVYCMTCDDLVIDPQLERIRLANGSNKRKFDDYATPEEYRLVAANSTHVPCRAIGLRGFYNMGNTCFMSVVLQCILHNPMVRQYFLSDGHNRDDCKREYCVGCALDEIFTEFYSTEKTEGYGAVTMLQNTWKTAESTGSGLAGYEQQDAHEYMQFMINALHTASGGTTESDCKCTIHSIFYGRLHSILTCSHCKTKNLSIEAFLDLSLDIPSQSKKKMNGEDKNAEHTLRLQDCLQRFIRGETLTYSCRTCKTQREGEKQFTVLKLPPVLCIHLKRFSHSKDKSSKLSTRVNFPLKLDMMPFTTLYNQPKIFLEHSKSIGDAVKATTTSNGTSDTPSKSISSAPENGTPSKTNSTTDPKSSTASPSKPTTVSSPKQPYEELLKIPKDEWPINLLSYHLSAVIVHKGEINSGHYVNYAREGNDWFLFDDSKVVLVSESEVLNSEAYLLLYVLEDLTPWIDGS